MSGEAKMGGKTCKGGHTFFILYFNSPFILVTFKLSSNMYFSGDHSFEHIKFPNFCSRANKKFSGTPERFGGRPSS